MHARTATGFNGSFRHLARPLVLQTQSDPQKFSCRR
jgi:hypothetical protein